MLRSKSKYTPEILIGIGINGNKSMATHQQISLRQFPLKKQGNEASISIVTAVMEDLIQSIRKIA